MTYGITGNTGKEALWQPAAGLIRWLETEGIPFRLDEHVGVRSICIVLHFDTSCAEVDGGRLDPVRLPQLLLDLDDAGWARQVASQYGRHDSPQSEFAIGANSASLVRSTDWTLVQGFEGHRTSSNL